MPTWATWQSEVSSRVLDTRIDSTSFGNNVLFSTVWLIIGQLLMTHGQGETGTDSQVVRDTNCRRNQTSYRQHTTTMSRGWVDKWLPVRCLCSVRFCVGFQCSVDDMSWPTAEQCQFLTMVDTHTSFVSQRIINSYKSHNIKFKRI